MIPIGLSMAKDRLSRKLVVILHADVVGSTTLVQRNETLAHERIQTAFSNFSETIEGYGGIAREIRGDALVAEFQRASDAVTSAIAFQAQNEKFNAAIDDDIRPVLRIGISLGEVIIADNTITGAGVVLAQRLEQLAESGGVVVQGAVSETVPVRMPFEFKSLGEQMLKGFDHPVRIFAARIRPGEKIPAADNETTLRSAETDNLSVADSRPTIAVLPFTNMSNEPEQEYFADGVTEDIITALSRIRWFFVIARNSTFAFKGHEEDIREIAQQLGVRYILEGSVRKSGNRVRVTVQLIDSAMGKHVWADRYDRELAEIFAVQDEITETIVGALEPELGKAERERAKKKRPGNLGAWDLYQRGLSHLYKPSKENLAKAQQFFHESIALDPSLGPAFSGSAEAYYFALVYGYSDSLEGDRQEALVAAQKGVGLDDQDASAHCTLGRIYYARKEHDLAIPELETALAINPSLAWAHYGIGASLVFSGKATEALLHLETAIKLSPHDPNMGSFVVRMADAHLFMGRHDDAVDWAKKALRQPNFQWSRYAVLIAALGHLGRLKEARRYLKELQKLRPDFSINFVQETHLITGAGDMDHYLEGLRKAGLSD